MNKFNAYINGEFVNTNNTLEIISPLDNKVAGEVSALKESEIEKAFDSARTTYPIWRKIPKEQRVKYINDFAKLLDKNKTELADIMNKEIGKKKSDSIAEIERTIQYIYETLVAWDEIEYSSIEISNKKANLFRLPLGVVLAISPFNYPVNLSLAKIIPALLVGNTVVFKPATNGSLTGSFIVELFHKASFPRGTINLVTGRGRDIGNALTANKEIDMITFTGSVNIGKNIAKETNMIPLVLELGGNDMAYVKEDSNMDLAIGEVVKGAFSYSGQRCTAIKRLALHKNIANKFIEELKNRVKNLELEPLITISAANYVSELIDDSHKRDDEFILEGKIKDNIVPAHIVKTTKESRAWKEEAFGPLLPIIIVDEDKEIVQLFNDSDFGLQNSIFTSNIEWAKEIAQDIESGTVNINRSSSRGPDIFPFSGIKDSGFGTQGIKDALISMTRVHNIVEND